MNTISLFPVYSLSDDLSNNLSFDPLSDEQPIISVAVSPESVTENGADKLVFTFSRTGNITNALDVLISIEGTASNYSDYSQTGINFGHPQYGDAFYVHFGEWSETTTVTVNPYADNNAESDETVTLRILDNPDNSSYGIGINYSATGTIIEPPPPPPLISISGPYPDSLAEDSFGNLEYIFNRTGDLSQPLTIRLDVSGTATFSFYDASDYQVLGADLFDAYSGMITFNAGSDTVSLWVDPVEDGQFEPDETVILTLREDADYDIDPDNDTATVTIINDDEKPIISVAVSPESVSENGADKLVFTFSRTGSITNALDVLISIEGTASDDSDYSQTGINFGHRQYHDAFYVHFGEGSEKTTVTVNPYADNNAESDETVTLKILETPDNSGYGIGINYSATGTIIEPPPPPPLINLSVSPNSISENASGNLVYTFKRTQNLYEALTVYFTVGGTATFSTLPNLSDYNQSGANTFNSATGSVTFSAGSDQELLLIDPVNDQKVEANETVILTLQSNPNYQIGTNSTATGTILNDDEPPIISISVSPESVTEDGSVNLIYTLTRTGDISNSLTVDFNLAGTASFSPPIIHLGEESQTPITFPKNDYTLLGASSLVFLAGSVIFNAGASQAILTVDPITDNTLEENETVIISLQSNPNYQIGTNSTATGAITNDDVQFVMPIGGIPYVDWTIGNYVDKDPSSGIRDYRGGTYTYNGHDAIDFGLANFVVMERGIPVHAAAAGKVICVHDGEFDRNTPENPVSLGRPNFVTIDHGQGIITNYYHFRKNSISVSVGDMVSAGQKIGEVGSSGNSSDAHLHFSVYENGQVIDTFDNVNKWWKSSPPQYGGDVPGSLDHGISDHGPSWTELRDRPEDRDIFRQAAGQSVFQWVQLHGIAQNDRLDFDFRRPNNSLYSNLNWTVDPIHGGWWVAGVNLPNTPDLGVWKIDVRRNNNLLFQDSFEVISNNAPALSINDVSATEGDSGTTNVTFTVTRSGIATQPITVNYATANGTATAGEKEDYQAITGTLNFATNETQKTIIVPIRGDTAVEPNEYFFVNLTNPTNAVLLDTRGTGNIRDNNDLNQAPTDILLTKKPASGALPIGTPLGNFSSSDPNTGDTFTYSLVSGAGSTDNYLFKIVCGQLQTNTPLNTANAFNYSIRVRTTDRGGLSYEEIIPIAKPKGNAWGDVHFVTFDGRPYDLQSFGEFILTKSTVDNWQIQVRQEPWGKSDFVSVTTALATTMDGYRVVFDLDFEVDQKLKINGNNVTLTSGQALTLGNSQIQRQDDIYTLTYAGADGILATGDDDQVIIRDYGTVAQYLDVEVLPSYGRMTLLQGFLGNADGLTTNDFALRNGTQLSANPSIEQLHGEYANSWRITSQESLFVTPPPPPSNPTRLVTLGHLDPQAVRAAQKLALEAGIPQGAILDAVAFDLAATHNINFLQGAIALFAPTVPQATVNTAIQNNWTTLLGFPTGPITDNPSPVDPTPTTIMGTNKADTLTGTTQNERLVGLLARDILTGGGGDDIFGYNSLSEAGDTITDFSVGDRLDLSQVLDSIGYTGTDPLGDKYVRFLGRTNLTTIQVDVDGLGSTLPKEFVLVQGVDVGVLNNPANFIF